MSQGDDHDPTQETAPISVPYDPFDATVESNYRLYEELRVRCPVSHSDAQGGFYMLTRYQDVRAAALNWRAFSSAGGIGFPRNRPMRLPAIEMDGEEHTAWRKLYTNAFTASTLGKLELDLRMMANLLIDRFAASGTCDLVADFAEPLPVLGVCRAIGLDDVPHAEVLRLADDFQASRLNPTARQTVMDGFASLVLDRIADRRVRPREDYLTRIALAEIDGARMDNAQITIFMLGFLVAGHETTTSALSSLLFHILDKPDIRARAMMESAALNAAIEEAVRLHSPLHGMQRTAVEPTNIDGVTIPKDGYVRLCFASANRDPKAFKDPDTFIINRERNLHLGFGFGRHVCAGAPLARLEMRTGVTELMKRLPDIKLVTHELKQHFVGGLLATPCPLQARFTPVATPAVP